MQRLLQLGLLLAVLPGCALLRGQGERGFLIDVVDVQTRFDEEGTGQVRLSLEVANPLAREVEVNQLDWELWLEGRFFAAGTQVLSEPLAAAQRRQLVLELPVRVRRGPLSEPRDFRAGVRGVLLVQRTGFDRALRFERKLTLEKARVPLASLGRDEE